MKEIRRKHFRFPAYDDELGVKLTSEKKRVLFDGQEDLLTEQNQHPFEQMKNSISRTQTLNRSDASAVQQMD